MRLRNGKLIGGKLELIKEMDLETLLNQIQNIINEVEERMERRMERLENLLGKRDEQDFQISHHKLRKVNNNSIIENKRN